MLRLLSTFFLDFKQNKHLRREYTRYVGVVMIIMSSAVATSQTSICLRTHHGWWTLGDWRKSFVLSCLRTNSVHQTAVSVAVMGRSLENVETLFIPSRYLRTIYLQILSRLLSKILFLRTASRTLLVILTLKCKPLLL